jgi:hypothetical protein
MQRNDDDDDDDDDASGPAVGSCEHGNELAGCITVGEFLA